MKKGHVVLMLGAAAIGLLALSPVASAADVSFKGKTVRMIVGSPPGGGTDLGGRMFARFIGKYLPGSPVIVVQNVPGASDIKAMNFMVQQAPADGTTFIAGSSSEITPDVVLKNPAVAYDPTGFEMIGGVAQTGTVLVASKAGMERIAKTGEPIAVAQVGGARTGAQMPLWGAAHPQHPDRPFRVRRACDPVQPDDALPQHASLLDLTTTHGVAALNQEINRQASMIGSSTTTS